MTEEEAVFGTKETRTANTRLEKFNHRLAEVNEVLTRNDRQMHKAELPVRQETIRRLETLIFNAVSLLLVLDREEQHDIVRDITDYVKEQ